MIFTYSYCIFFILIFNRTEFAKFIFNHMSLLNRVNKYYLYFN